MRHPESQRPVFPLATAVLLVVAGAAVPGGVVAARGPTPARVPAAPVASAAVPPAVTEAVDEPVGAADCSDASLDAKADKAKPATAAAPAELQGRKVFTCMSVNMPVPSDAPAARTEARQAIPLPAFRYVDPFEGSWRGNRTENCMIAENGRR